MYGIKGGLTDSMKRAAKTGFGIGRYLNDYPYTSVKVEDPQAKYLTYAHKQLLSSQYNIQYNMASGYSNSKNNNNNINNLQNNRSANVNNQNSKSTTPLTTQKPQHLDKKSDVQVNNKVVQEQIEKPKSNGAIDGMKNYIINTCKISNLDIVEIISEYNIYDIDDITFEIGSKVVNKINKLKKQQQQALVG